MIIKTNEISNLEIIINLTNLRTVGNFLATAEELGEPDGEPRVIRKGKIYPYLYAGPCRT